MCDDTKRELIYGMRLNKSHGGVFDKRGRSQEKRRPVSVGRGSRGGVVVELAQASA